jgi:hypothetical protein
MKICFTKDLNVLTYMSIDVTNQTIEQNQNAAQRLHKFLFSLQCNALICTEAHSRESCGRRSNVCGSLIERGDCNLTSCGSYMIGVVVRLIRSHIMGISL